MSPASPPKKGNRGFLRWDWFVGSVLLAWVQMNSLSVRATTLVWSPSTDPNVAGYHIYYGTTSRNYTQMAATGTNTTLTLYGLLTGVTYYFAATTYDSQGNQSGYSTEVSYTVPQPSVTITNTSMVNGQYSFTATGQINGQFVIQASTNLSDWIPLQTNTLPFTFVDNNAGSFSQRYYRTVYLDN